MKKIGDVLNKNDSFSIEDFSNIYSEDITKLADNIDKQEVFDRFLTYRRRMARLAAVQTLYLYDVMMKSGNLSSSSDMFGTNEIDIEQLCDNVLNYYKNVFFTPQEYGWTKKNKKLDESFMTELVGMAISSMKEIDSFIQSRLSGNWTIDKLDFVLRAIIRCAVAEILLGVKIEKAVLCSEYTNLAGNFFNGKEIGFINGIVDKLYSLVIKIHPFIDGVVINDETTKNNF